MAEAPPLTVKIVYVQEDELRKIVAEEVRKALLPDWTKPQRYIPNAEATVHEDNLNGE